MNSSKCETFIGLPDLPEFTTFEVLYQIWWLKPFLVCLKCTKKLKNQELFERVYHNFAEDIDIIGILKRLQKVEENSHFIRDIKPHIDI